MHDAIQMNIFICNSLSSVIYMLPRTISSFAVFGKGTTIFIAVWKEIRCTLN